QVISYTRLGEDLTSSLGGRMFAPLGCPGQQRWRQQTFVFGPHVEWTEMASNDRGDRIAVERVQATLAERGGKWQARANFLTEVPVERRRQYLGFTPPPGLTLQDLEERARGIAAGHQPGLQTAGFPPSFD